MATFIITTDNSRWQDSIETAHLILTLRRTIYIRKLPIAYFAEEQRSLIWRCVGDPMVRNRDRKVEVTEDELRTLYELSKR